MADEKISVIIADNQFLTREAIIGLLKNDQHFLIAGTPSAFLELELLLKKVNTGILIIDPKQFEIENVNGLKSIALNYSGFHVLIITNPLQPSEANELIRLNFKHIVYKTSDKEEVLDAIEATRKGKKFYSDELMEQLFGANNGNKDFKENNSLTLSEIEIVKHIAEGLTTKEIASKKNLSFHTINTHRKNIFRKLGVSNTSELIIYAIKAGLIDNIEYYI